MKQKLLNTEKSIDKLKQDNFFNSFVNKKKKNKLEMQKNLNEKNEHLLDKTIKFIGTGDRHDYINTLEGTKFRVGCTTFKSKFVPEFDREFIFKRMFKDMDENGCIPKNKKSDYRGCNRQDVLQIWKKSNVDGTALHDIIENYLNNISEKDYIQLNLNEKRNLLLKYVKEGDTQKHMQCISQYLDFEENWILEGWKPYRVEWTVFDKQLDMAGTIDAVFKRVSPETGREEFCIIDWKRSKAYLKQINYPKNNYYPIEDLDSSKLTQYQLQVNIYGYILKRNYGIDITKYYILQLNPKRRAHTLYEVDNIEKKIHSMMQCWNNYRKLERNILLWEKNGCYLSSIHPKQTKPVFFESKNEYKNF